MCRNLQHVCWKLQHWRSAGCAIFFGSIPFARMRQGMPHCFPGGVGNTVLRVRACHRVCPASLAIVSEQSRARTSRLDYGCRHLKAALMKYPGRSKTPLKTPSRVVVWINVDTNEFNRSGVRRAVILLQNDPNATDAAHGNRAHAFQRARSNRCAGYGGCGSTWRADRFLWRDGAAGSCVREGAL